MRKTKLYFFIFCLCLFLLTVVSIPRLVFNIQSSEDITYFFYAQTPYCSIDADVIVCGDASIVRCSGSSAQKIKSQLKNIQGESFRAHNCTSKTKFELLNKYKKNVVMQENIDNMQIFYCFDETLPRFVNVDGKKVNIQIVINNNEVNIGYPLILNGY